MLSDPILKVGLSAADVLLGRAPAWAAYGVADTAGRTWFRTAEERRALVTENLRRVCEATGRPTGGAVLRRMVERAFVEHARYYLELLRSPHYPVERIERFVGMEEWDDWEPIMRGGAVVALAHFGNFEPYGLRVAGQSEFDGPCANRLDSCAIMVCARHAVWRRRPGREGNRWRP